jgi:hypothetical protein
MGTFNCRLRHLKLGQNYCLKAWPPRHGTLRIRRGSVSRHWRGSMKTTTSWMTFKTGARPSRSYTHQPRLAADRRWRATLTQEMGAHAVLATASNHRAFSSIVCCTWLLCWVWRDFRGCASMSVYPQSQSGGRGCRVTPTIHEICALAVRLQNRRGVDPSLKRLCILPHV